MGPGHLYREPQRGILSQELFWVSSPSSPAFPRGFAGEPETTQGTANMEAPRVLVGRSPVPLRSRCLLPGSWLENRAFPLQSRCRPLVETGAKVMPELQAPKYGESLNGIESESHDNRVQELVLLVSSLFASLCLPFSCGPTSACRR